MNSRLVLAISKQAKSYQRSSVGVKDLLTTRKFSRVPAIRPFLEEVHGQEVDTADPPSDRSQESRKSSTGWMRAELS